VAGRHAARRKPWENLMKRLTIAEALREGIAE